MPQLTFFSFKIWRSLALSCALPDVGLLKVSRIPLPWHAGLCLSHPSWFLVASSLLLGGDVSSRRLFLHEMPYANQLMWRCGSIKCTFHPRSLSWCYTSRDLQALPQAALTVFVLQLLLVSDGWSGLQKLTRAPPMATMTTSKEKATRNKSSTFRDCFNPKGTNATAENS